MKYLSESRFFVLPFVTADVLSMQVETDPQFLGRIMALYGLTTAMGALLAVLLTSQYSSDSPTVRVLLCGAGSAVLGVLLWRFEKVAPKPS